jgi:hypothetical protein
LKDNKDVCLASVSQSGYALRLVSERLKGDKDVCLAAISQNSNAFHNVSDQLRKDKEFFLAASQKNPNILSQIFMGVPDDIVPLEFKGKFFSPSVKKVLTVHNKNTTTLFKLCMQKCQKSVYGFPEEIQEMVLTHVGSLESRFIERKDRVGEKRRRNFMDDEFGGRPFSIANE